MTGRSNRDLRYSSPRGTETLHKTWLRRYFIQVVTPYILLVLLGGAFCFLSAHAWRQRSVYVIQLAMLAGVLTLIAYLAIDVPVSRGTQQALRVLVTVVLYWALCLAGYRLSGVQSRTLVATIHGLSALTLVATVALLIMGNVTDKIWLLTWPHVLLRLVVIGVLMYSAWLTGSFKRWALSLTAAFWTATVAQSYFIIMEWLPWDSFRWSIAGAMPFCLVLIFCFAEHFILERQHAIDQQHAAIVEEREQILQDMHDGMGAHLITALHLARRSDVDREDLARSIEESLHDLRLIIDSLDLTEHDVLPLLGNLRFRLEPRLKALGIGLEWDVLPPLPELTYLTPNSALAILRIVQEAINNAIQHAHERAVRITARPEDEWILIEVSDDGRGFVPRAGARSSRGLNGMRLRAGRLGAALTVHSAAPGSACNCRADPPDDRLVQRRPPARHPRFRVCGQRSLAINCERCSRFDTFLSRFIVPTWAKP